MLKFIFDTEFVFQLQLVGTRYQPAAPMHLRCKIIHTTIKYTTEITFIIDLAVYLHATIILFCPMP